MSLVYHFTSLNAVASILGEGQPILRMTGCSFMNDPTEIEPLRNVGGLIRQVGGKSGFNGELASRIISRVENCELYAACFSETVETLSQWRAYAPGPTGVAIGLEAEEFPEDAVPQRIRYERLRAPDGAHIQEILARIEAERMVGDSPTEKEFVFNATRDVMLCKPSEYGDERELRSFRHSRDPEGFYPGRYGMTPFVSLKLPRSAIRNVFVSPAADSYSSRLVELPPSNWTDLG